MSALTGPDSTLDWVYANHPDSAISRQHALALYNAVRHYRPETVIEVGLANGASAVAIGSALRDNGGGRLISIDPNQREQFGGRGLEAMARSQLSQHHEFIEEPSYLALPELLRRGVKAEFAYIDGWHSFDYVLVDFFFLDKLLNPGGVVGFNDTGWASVRKVLSFVRRYRKYSEVDVGLKPDYRGRNLAFTLGRRLFGRQAQDRYFQKQSNFEPQWNFYADF